MFDTLWSICSIGGLLLTFQNCFVVVQSAQMRLVFPGFTKWPFYRVFTVYCKLKGNFRGICTLYYRISF